MRNLESKLQINCVRWFDLAYPKYRQLLFAVPNGHVRNKITASICKAEGVRAGVADMFLSISHPLWCGLYIEFKVGRGKQTDSQVSFQKAVEGMNYRYEVVSDFDSFKDLIENYITTTNMK